MFRWDVSERIDDDFLDYLSANSCGAFLPDVREFDSEVVGEDEYVFLRLRHRERSTQIWLGSGRGNDYDSFLEDLNRFISGSGRQFVMAGNGWIGGYFACLTPEELALLHGRGLRFSALPPSDLRLAPPRLGRH